MRLLENMASTLVLLLSIFTVQLIHAAPFWDAVDPEQILFIATRCMEDWSVQAKDPKEALDNWMNWKLQPSNDAATHCYTKCMLTKIGFYDLAEKRFKGVRVVQQWETYGKYQFADREKVLALGDDFDFIKPLQSSSCSSIFNAYKDVHARNVDTIKAILFGDVKSAEKFYTDKGDKVKQKGQSLFEFCENINYPIGSDIRKKELCKIRNYELGSGKEFENHMACIFKGLRYMNKKNDVDFQEILRDFRLAGKTELYAVTDVLVECEEKLKAEDAGAIAVHFYKCLLSDSKLRSNFKDAFDYREIRSQDYMSLLKNDKPYDKNEVRQMVDQIDKKQCT